MIQTVNQKDVLMTKTLTYRSLVMALLLATGFQSAFAQTFWTETFSDEASSTTNWVSGGDNLGAEVWTWTSDPLAGFQDPAVPAFGAATAGDGYFLFNSDANGENNAHDVTLTGVGNPANCTGQSGVHLKFYTQYFYFGINNARVGVSTNGTDFTYYQILSDLPESTIFDGEIDLALPEADNQAQVWIQFRWEGNWEYHWKVDDLELSGQAGVVSCIDNPDKIICDDFESYNVGNLSSQSPHWIPWDLNDAANNVVSAEVSTEQASNGTKSMKVKPDGASGDDQLLQLGNRTSGRYSLKWKYYIPTGKAAYFNIQTDETDPGATNDNFALQVYFRTTGVVDVTDPTPAVAGTYPQGVWFPVELVMDLDNNLAKFFVNGALVKAWGYDKDFGAIDFYAENNNTYLAYVDEVEFISLPAIVYNVDDCANAVDLTQYFGQTPDVPQTTGLYDNTDATVAATDPAVTCWNENASGANDIVNGSMWYTFTGDGANYHIETVPCNATNYIGTAQQDPGDTQMAIYEGSGCGDLTLVACNDDLFTTGEPDWRAGLDLQTESGTNYYMLIDGFEFQGTLALGEYCIEITQTPSVTCDNGAVGTYTVANDGFVCNLANLGALITMNTDEFAIPTVGPVYGMLWAISSAPIPSGQWPGDAAGFLGGTGVLQNVFAVGLVNDNDPFAYGPYYVTPVVLGGATDTDPSNGPSVFDVDPSTGCFFVGASTLVTLMPPLNDLSIDNADVTSSSIDITVSGGLAEFLADPSLYIFSWTGPGGFTASTEDISGLTVSGAYSVVISDPSGCIDAYTQTFDVTTGTEDPSSIKTLTISPNPTRNTVTLNLSLVQAGEVRIDVVNTIGQVLQTLNVGQVSNLSQQVELGDLSDGTYFLRISVDGDVTQRSVVLQR